MTRSTSRRALPQLAVASTVAGIVAALVAALSGCATASMTLVSPSASPSPTTSASSTPTPSSDPAPVSSAFVTPTECTGLLGSALEQKFLAAGDVLFSDSNGSGIYPDAPIGQDGGTPFACLYGKDMVDLSTFELAAQGLTPGAHEGVLAELGARGLTMRDEGRRVVFTQEGNEGTTPAIVHLLYPEAWITVYSTFGGAARLAEIRGWADTVATQVYPTG